MFRKLLGWWMLASTAALVACGGGSDAGTSVFGGTSSSSSSTTETYKVALSLSSTTVTSATPVTATAVVTSSTGKAVAGTVVTFSTAAGLGSLSASTALTDTSGAATITLSPASSATSGADTLTASVSVNGTAVSGTAGFQLSATSATFTSLTAATGTGDTSSTRLSAYGQTVLTIAMSGVGASAPATVTLTSACIAKSKASISPTSVTTTANTITATYTDQGCGAVLSADTVTATLSGSGKTVQGPVYLTSPTANSLTFVSASPSTIYLKGSGLAESSTVKFTVNDTAGNALPGQSVTLGLTTYTGGLTIDGGTASVTKTTDANGAVSVIINSGTVPTPVRVSATLNNGAANVSTVSSQLAVGVGLPSQLNFSLSQATKNLECMNIDGVANTYTIYAADRSGNPVPSGTAITFWAEGGQIQTSVQSSLNASGIASAKANFVCQSPRPADGRVTIVAYAVGEESFIDLNGNNQYDSGEPFQDLGDVVKDKLFDNVFDPANDEYVSFQNATGVCNEDSSSSWVTSYPQLALDASIPSRPGTCDGIWTGKTYVRRATETVMSTSQAGLLWGGTAGLDSSSCHATTLQSGSAASSATTYYQVGSGDTWYGGAAQGVLPVIIADANGVRLNPMAAGTTLDVSNATAVTSGGTFTVNVLGTPVPSTADATTGAITYVMSGTAAGSFTLNVTSPSGLKTSYAINVNSGSRTTTCP